MRGFVEECWDRFGSFLGPFFEVCSGVQCWRLSPWNDVLCGGDLCWRYWKYLLIMCFLKSLSNLFVVFGLKLRYDPSAETEALGERTSGGGVMMWRKDFQPQSQYHVRYELFPGAHDSWFRQEGCRVFEVP